MPMMMPQAMPTQECCPGRLPPEKQTSAVPHRATPMAPSLRPEMVSPKRKRDMTATQMGAVYIRTTAMAAPLSLMAYWVTE